MVDLLGFCGERDMRYRVAERISLFQQWINMVYRE
jgi:hypothetical protein